MSVAYSRNSQSLLCWLKNNTNMNILFPKQGPTITPLPSKRNKHKTFILTSSQSRWFKKLTKSNKIRTYISCIKLRFFHLVISNPVEKTESIQINPDSLNQKKLYWCQITCPCICWKKNNSKRLKSYKNNIWNVSAIPNELKLSEATQEKKKNLKKLFGVQCILPLIFSDNYLDLHIKKKKKRRDKFWKGLLFISPMCYLWFLPWSISRRTLKDFSVAIFLQVIFWHKSKALVIKLKCRRLLAMDLSELHKMALKEEFSLKGRSGWAYIMRTQKRHPWKTQNSRKHKWILWQTNTQAHTFPCSLSVSWAGIFSRAEYQNNPKKESKIMHLFHLKHSQEHTRLTGTATAR